MKHEWGVRVMLLAFSKITKSQPTAQLCRTVRQETAVLTSNFKKQRDTLLQLLESMKHDNQESVDRLKSEG